MTLIKHLFKFSLLLVGCVLLASCDREELPDINGAPLPNGKYPLVLTTTINGELTSRAAGKDAWTAGDIIGARIGNGTAGSYTVAAGGALTALTPVYWQNTASATVTAWYPADAQTDVNISDQSAGFAAFDFLKAEVPNCTYNQPVIALPFKHVMAKVRVTIVAANAETDLTGAEVRILGRPSLNYSEGTVTSSVTNAYITAQKDGAAYEALLVPQQMATGTLFIKVTLNGDDYFYTLQAGEADLQRGGEYGYTITVNATSIIDLTKQVGDYTATKNCIIDGKGQSLDKKIVIAADVEVILKDVILTPTTNGNGITCKGNATITLQGTNDVKGYNADVFSDYCGILAEAGTMIIDGMDDTYLTATGGGVVGYGAGIGATNSANITINGGNITAQASYDSAGIGSAGWDHTCGDITITGGIINAIGENYAAGIGGSNPGNCGNILITGGNIQATGGIASPGIGSGTAASCGTIDITGEAVVVATKGLGASVSIGHSFFGGSCGVVTIMSPNVTQN